MQLTTRKLDNGVAYTATAITGETLKVEICHDTQHATVWANDRAMGTLMRRRVIAKGPMWTVVVPHRGQDNVTSQQTTDIQRMAVRLAFVQIEQELQWAAQDAATPDKVTLHADADHVAPKWACHGEAFEVTRSRQGMWSAWNGRYGCSKDYSTPEAAVRSLLADSACTNIRIAPSKPGSVDEARAILDERNARKAARERASKAAAVATPEQPVWVFVCKVKGGDVYEQPWQAATVADAKRKCFAFHGWTDDSLELCAWALEGTTAALALRHMPFN